MSRKQVSRSLPPLSAMVPGRLGFAPHENHSRKLLEILRKVVRRVRRKQPHPFYSMRKVAGFFHVSVPTVRLVYKKLEQEGFLAPLRGSMTLVQPSKMRPRIPVRAVVGLPVWLPGFLQLRDWRLFFIHFEEYLRQHNFVADFVFYGTTDNTLGDFSQRLLAHEFDIVIWFTPDRGVQQPMQILMDNGVRFIAISGATYLYPGHQYGLSWERALKDALNAWKQEGICKVVIPRSSGQPQEDFQGLMEAIAHTGMQFSHPHPRNANWSRYISELTAGLDTGVIFDDDLWCTHLCNHAPEVMIRLFKERRVLMTRSINLPDAYLKDLRVDMAYMDWYKVGRRVVEDLMAQKTFVPNKPVILHAQWRPRVTASEIEGVAKF